jgi:diacylglycerol kinase
VGIVLPDYLKCFNLDFYNTKDMDANYKRKRFTVKDRLMSFRYAINGLKLLFKTEHNARIHLVVSLLAVTLGVLLDISSVEWGLVFIVIGLVFIAELFNSAIEFLADFVSPGYALLVGKAKDLAAAGVLLASVLAVAIGIVVFLPKLVSYIVASGYFYR